MNEHNNKSNIYKEKFYERYIKRLFDILFSTIALILLSPFSLLCILAIKIDDIHGDVFFKQERNGKNGKVFKIVKFRTMKRELCGKNIDPEVDTLTSAGKIIRKLSLDEIPQFISIIRGQMSLIGPRPLLVSYYKWFTETELRRFNVRPGLTGLSQINGRVNLSWDERFVLDVQYADNLSILLDAKIFFKTFLVVFSHKDVLLENGSTLECFDVYRERIQKQKQSTVVAFRPSADNTEVTYRPKSHRIQG